MYSVACSKQSAIFVWLENSTAHCHIIAQKYRSVPPAQRLRIALECAPECVYHKKALKGCEKRSCVYSAGQLHQLRTERIIEVLQPTVLGQAGYTQ